MRELTLKVVILDPEKAKWIWEAHVDPKVREQMGIDVQRIANGDRFDDSDNESSYKSKDFYVVEIGETFEEAIAAHKGGSFDTIVDAIDCAKLDLKPGSEYYVINEEHRVVYRGKT